MTSAIKGKTELALAKHATRWKSRNDRKVARTAGLEADSEV